MTKWLEHKFLINVDSPISVVMNWGFPVPLRVKTVWTISRRTSTKRNYSPILRQNHKTYTLKVYLFFFAIIKTFVSQQTFSLKNQRFQSGFRWFAPFSMTSIEQLTLDNSNLIQSRDGWLQYWARVEKHIALSVRLSSSCQADNRRSLLFCFFVDISYSCLRKQNNVPGPINPIKNWEK